MQIKLFEVRDHATFIPVMAIRLESETEAERWLISRAGFGIHPVTQRQYVLLFRLGEIDHSVGQWNPKFWRSQRTMREAHQYIHDNFEILESGAVVDVAYILHETPEPVLSEHLQEEEFDAS